MTTVASDLDGVVYRGSEEVAGSGRALHRLSEAGFGLLFVTNNSARPPDEIAAKIRRVTGWPASEEQVVTSAMAAASMLQPGADSPALVVGERGIEAAVSERGIATTTNPLEAESVVVGICRHISYELLAAAGKAIRAGARYLATNLDPTVPVEDGFQPGAGAITAAVTAVGGVKPEVAGKPNQPMIRLIESRADGPVWIVGDRQDTDIELAAGKPDWTSILVLSGATPSGEVLDGPDYMAADLAAAADLVIDSSKRQ